MNTIRRLAASAVFVCAAVAAQAADEGREYPDGHGGSVYFPLGDVSFADAVERYSIGDPAPRDYAADPAQTLGVPDTSERGKGSYLSLGCAGELVLRFEDNALIDVPGPDLYVFEIGPDVEPTGLAVSDDGETWTRIGRISGGKAEIDLAPYTAEASDFRYVRLVDLKKGCNSRNTPGADIDAVGAIGSATRIALDSAVLFDTGKHSLKAAAHAAIDEVLADIDDRAETDVTVAGHTDSVGSTEDNERLSRKRAQAVADYLVNQAGFSADRVTLRAYGESRPVASNDTESGRARNRRVELTVRATRSADGESTPDIEILGLWDAKSRGILELRRVDGELEGDYTAEGKFVGEFTSDTVFEGYWIKDSSRKACDTKKGGSDHWGPLRLEFDGPDRDTFTAHWRYCGEQEDRGTWKEAERLL